MAWLSFVIVTLLFILGQENLIPHEPFVVSLPFIPLPISIPYSGHLRMLFWLTVIWLGIWLILLALTRLLGVKPFERAGLRNGLLFATRPFVVNELAKILATIVLGLTILQFLLDLLTQFLRANILSYLYDSLVRNLTGKSVGAVFDFATGTLRSGDLRFWPFDSRMPVIPIMPFLSGGGMPALPIPLFPRSLLVLSVLTLIASYGFRREQSWRYAEEVKRNQDYRKTHQDDIKSPLSDR